MRTTSPKLAPASRERVTDELEAEARLLVCALGRVALARDRRRAGHVHAPAAHDRARVAHDRLVGRVPGDEAALHEASIARRGSPSPDRRLGRGPRRCCRRAAGRRRRCARAGEHVFRWASVTKLATALAALVAVEEGVVDLDDPAGPRGRDGPPPARARERAPIRRRPADRSRRRAPDLLQPRLRGARRPRGGPRRDAVRPLPRRGRVRPARDGRRAARVGRGGRARHARRRRRGWPASS